MILVVWQLLFLDIIVVQNSLSPGIPVDSNLENNMFGSQWTVLDKVRQVCIGLDGSEKVWVGLDNFRKLWIGSDMFG